MAMRAAARAGQFHIPGFAAGGPVVPGRGNPHSKRQYPWATYAGDFPNPIGTPVHAWKDGVIALVRSLTTSYGKHIRMNHTDGTSSLYAHLSSFAVRMGEIVRQGQIIGRVGSTGNSTGPHLHLELMGGPYTGGSGGGDEQATGVLDWIKSKFDIDSVLESATGFMRGRGGIFGDSGAVGLVKSIGGSVWDWIKSKVGSATEFVSGMGSKIKGLLGFDSGGIANGKGLMFKDVIAPERVLAPSSTRALDEGLRNIGRIGPLDGPVEVVLSEKDKSDIAVLLGQELAAGAAKAVDRYDFVMASQARNGGGL